MIGELFDALAHFTQAREAPDVRFSLSGLIYEPNGAFDQHLLSINKTSSDMNALILNYPVLANAMSVGSGSSSNPGGGGDDKGAGKKTEPKFKWKKNTLLFGKGVSGPKYDAGKIMEELNKVDPNLDSRTNFCLVNYLSTTNACTNPKHSSGGWHKISPAIKALRDKFEHKPYRTDAKAK